MRSNAHHYRTHDNAGQVPSSHASVRHGHNHVTDNAERASGQAQSQDIATVREGNVDRSIPEV